MPFPYYKLIVGKRHCRVMIVGNGKVRRLDCKTIKYLQRRTIQGVGSPKSRTPIEQSHKPPSPALIYINILPKEIAVHFYCWWGGAGLLYCLLQSNIVGKTRPYGFFKLPLLYLPRH